MLISNDNYYLIGYNDFYKNFLHFRIDRITETRISHYDIVESEEIRHASDYDDFYIATREEAEEQIQTAKELVSRVEEYVQARWKKESEKTVRNAEYLDMIDRGIAQLSAGNGQEHELNETDCGCLTT